MTNRRHFIIAAGLLPLLHPAFAANRRVLIGGGGWGGRNSREASAGMLVSAALRIRPDCKAHSAATCRVTTDSAITALRLSPVDGA